MRGAAQSSAERIEVDKLEATLKERYPDVPFNDDIKTSVFKFFGKEARDATRTEISVAEAMKKRTSLIKGMSDGMIKDIALREAGLTRVDNLINKIGVQNQDGSWAIRPGMEDKFGPVASRFNDFMRVWKAAPEDEKLFREMRSLLSELYGDAGKQLSNEELKIARDAWLADPGQQPANALAALQTMRGRMATNLSSLKAGLERAGVATDMSPEAMVELLNPYLKEPIKIGEKKEKPGKISDSDSRDFDLEYDTETGGFK
jgi:hypothetical protein